MAAIHTMKQNLKPIALVLLLPLGMACAEAATPAEIACKLSTICMGADQMLLSALPGQYVSCSSHLMGEACEGVYIPGQGAIIQFRVAFPLVPAASHANDPASTTGEADGEVAASGAAPRSPATEEHRTSQVQLQMRQLRAASTANSFSVTQMIYQHKSNQRYDAELCKYLVDEIARVLSHYASQLACIPEKETITVVVSGPADASPAGQLRQKAVLSTYVIQSPSGQVVTVPVGALMSPPQRSVQFSAAAPFNNDQGRSTLILSLVRGRLSSEASETRQAFNIASY